MKKRKQFLIYSLVFIPLFLGTFCGLYLNGKSFVWQGDGFRQYYPALQYLGRYYRSLISGVCHLDFSIPMMDYSIGQGEDIITTFCNYGLGDPFSLLAVFFTGKKSMEILYAVLIALRLYTAGIAFLCFANGKNWDKRDSLAGAFLYVFCGFALWSIKDPFFLNGMIYLPLVLLGVERIRQQRKPGVMILATCFCALSGYYFFYMIVLASVCYFVLTEIKQKPQNWKEVGKDLGAVFFPALSGTLMSSILLVPSLFGFLASSRGTVKVPLPSLLLYGGKYYKQLFTQFLAVTPSEDASAVWYFSMGALVFIVVVVTFMGERAKKKWWITGLGLTVLAVCSPLMGYVMNGMGYITNRFMFIASFFMACLVVKMLPEIYRLGSTQKKRLWLGAGGYGIAAGIVAGKESVVQSVCMVVFLMITCALLWFVKEEKKLRLALFVVLVCNIAANGNVMYQPFGANIQKTYLKAGTVQKQYDQKAVREAAKASDTTKMERVDVMTDRGYNPNRAVTMRATTHPYLGCSVYYSVVSGGFSKLMLALENSSGLMYSHRLIGMDGRSILDQLAGVRYVVCDEPSMVPYGYEKKSETLYENTEPVSIGYVYHAYMTETTAEKLDALDLQNALLHAAVVGEHSNLLKEAENAGLQEEVRNAQKTSLPFTMTDRKSFDWNQGVLGIKRKNGSFCTQITMHPGYEYYLRFRGLKMKKTEKNALWANVTMGELVREFVISDDSYDFHLDRDNYMVTLGSVTEEQTKDLRFRINGPAVYTLQDIEIVEVSMENYHQRVQDLMQEPVTDIKKQRNGMTGKVTNKEDGILCLAVPYRQGYRLMVDGKETEIQEINKMYVGAYLEKGENHAILLTYETPGLKMGVILTTIGVIFAAFLVIFNKKSLRG